MFGSNPNAPASPGVSEGGGSVSDTPGMRRLKVVDLDVLRDDAVDFGGEGHQRSHIGATAKEDTHDKVAKLRAYNVQDIISSAYGV